MFRKIAGAIIGPAIMGVVLVALSSMPVAATLIIEEKLDIYGDFDGDTLEYNFLGLPASDGSGGTLRVRTGGALLSDPDLNTNFDGLDLDQTAEFFTLIIDGNNAGNFACHSEAGVTNIPGNTGGVQCLFDITFDLFTDFGLDVENLVADGSLFAQLDFTRQVGFATSQDQVFVTLSYEAASAVPEPSTLGLFSVSSVYEYDLPGAIRIFTRPVVTADEDTVE